MCTADQRFFKADTVFDLECFLFMDVVIVSNRRNYEKESSAEPDALFRNAAEQTHPPTARRPEFVPPLWTLCFRISHYKRHFTHHYILFLHKRKRLHPSKFTREMGCYSGALHCTQCSKQHARGDGKSAEVNQWPKANYTASVCFIFIWLITEM